MFSLIIVIISVALVAILALATIYYGGESFNKGATKANATKLINQAQQLQGVSKLYKADHPDYTGYPSINTLVSEHYLSSAPIAMLSDSIHGEFFQILDMAYAANFQAWTDLMDDSLTSTISGAYMIFVTDATTCQAVNMKTSGNNGIPNSVYTDKVGVTTCYYSSSLGKYAVITAMDPAQMAKEVATGSVPKIPVAEIKSGAPNLGDSSNWYSPPTEWGVSNGSSASSGSGTASSGSGSTTMPTFGVNLIQNNLTWTGVYVQDIVLSLNGVATSEVNQLTYTATTGIVTAVKGVDYFDDWGDGYIHLWVPRSSFTTSASAYSSSLTMSTTEPKIGSLALAIPAITNASNLSATIYSYNYNSNGDRINVVSISAGSGSFIDVSGAALPAYITNSTGTLVPVSAYGGVQPSSYMVSLPSMASLGFDKYQDNTVTLTIGGSTVTVVAPAQSAPTYQTGGTLKVIPGAYDTVYVSVPSTFGLNLNNYASSGNIMGLYAGTYLYKTAGGQYSMTMTNGGPAGSVGGSPIGSDILFTLGWGSPVLSVKFPVPSSGFPICVEFSYEKTLKKTRIDNVYGNC